jgi:hypothetical protein
MTEEFVMVQFWVRDGEREYSVEAIVTPEEAQWSDKELIKHHLCETAEDYYQAGMYWVYHMEALAYVNSKKPITREVKELLSQYVGW